MNRASFEKYERESLLRSMGPYRHPRGGDDTAQQIIRNSERRKAVTKQKQEMPA